MINFKISEEIKKYAKYLTDHVNYGRRGDGSDGSKDQQILGMMVQTAVCKLLGCELPVISEHWDGGFDLIIEGHRVDVKGMKRQGLVKDYYVHNFFACQSKYDCEYYIFASYSTDNNLLSICGITHKDDLINKKISNYVPKGAIRYKGNTPFELKAAIYEFPQKRFIEIKSVEDIKRYIQETEKRKEQKKKDEEYVRQLEEKIEKVNNADIMDLRAHKEILSVFKNKYKNNKYSDEELIRKLHENIKVLEDMKILAKKVLQQWLNNKWKSVGLINWN